MDGRASFERDVAGIGALVDPVRRQLYQFVCSQSMPVSRDQAADAVGIPRHQAKFHLDRLTAEGLLDTEYARLTGRSGPGAGGPPSCIAGPAATSPSAFHSGSTSLLGG